MPRTKRSKRSKRPHPDCLIPAGLPAAGLRLSDTLAIQWTDLGVLQEIARNACPDRRFTNEQLLRTLICDHVFDSVWDAFGAQKCFSWSRRNLT